MAGDLEPQCNYLYGFFTCNLPEDTIDVGSYSMHSEGNTYLQKRLQYPIVYVQSMGYVSQTFPIPK